MNKNFTRMDILLWLFNLPLLSKNLGRKVGHVQVSAKRVDIYDQKGKLIFSV